MLSDELNHLPKFADFAKGDNSQLDAVSIQKYVARMVDVSQCIFTMTTAISSIGIAMTPYSYFPSIKLMQFLYLNFKINI